MTPSRHFGRTAWMGDQPIIRPLPRWDGTTQKNSDIHPCPQRDSNNTRVQCRGVQD